MIPDPGIVPPRRAIPGQPYKGAGEKGIGNNETRLIRPGLVSIRRLG